ncbi:MAG TPA: HemK/PrmC family methyltransferase, partial [Flavobacteriaceae bacterium]|nr:HemK/PrmC family methyltransferase [Flavobacteriaceae bacterium]
MDPTHFNKKFKEELRANYSVAEVNSAFHLLSEKYFKTNADNDESAINWQKNKLEEAIQRLKNNEPLEYILGEALFFGRVFKVNSNVHVPRVESETMINWVLEDFREIAKKMSLDLLDIGTGSGVLPITLKSEMPEISVSAMDISQKALEIARENADRLNTPIEFLQTDLFQLKSLPKKFDIIVSNPPYILKNAQKDVQR